MYPAPGGGLNGDKDEFNQKENVVKGMRTVKSK